MREEGGGRGEEGGKARILSPSISRICWSPTANPQLIIFHCRTAYNTDFHLDHLPPLSSMNSRRLSSSMSILVATVTATPWVS